jgi:hypothetical protein
VQTIQLDDISSKGLSQGSFGKSSLSLQNKTGGCKDSMVQDTWFYEYVNHHLQLLEEGSISDVSFGPLLVTSLQYNDFKYV